MKIISNILSDVKKVIGEQEYIEELNYRSILYHKSLKIKDGFLLYHTLTKELLLLTLNEYNDFINNIPNNFLVNHWFMIPEDIDERTLYQMFFQSYKTIVPRKKYGPLNLCTIFTTTECNARCPYCYEVGIQKKTMSEEIALDAAKYIANHTRETINLKWFGGEPLCNGKVITKICEYLLDKKINISSFIISNGYLFDKYDMDIIKNVWKLKRVQITLDGTSENYNKIKNYININNAFEKVNNNIKLLLDNEIRVSIRLNINSKNIDDIYNLVDYLVNKYSSYKNISVYCIPIYEGEWNIETSESKKYLYEKYIKLQEYIRSKGFGVNYSITGIKRYHCMADDGRSSVILPDGKLSVCEHHYDDDFYGTIYDDKNYDKNILNTYRKRRKEIPECKNCFYYPSCYELEKCSMVPLCCEETRKYKSWQVETMMKDTYKKYKNNLNK